MLTITTCRVHEITKWKNRGAMAIDVTVKNAKGATKELAPTWALVMGYKEGRLTEEEYTSQYRNRLKNAQKKSPEKWRNTILNNEGKTLVFACMCRPGDFCHRILLRDEMVRFAREELGIEVRIIEE